MRENKNSKYTYRFISIWKNLNSRRKFQINISLVLIFFASFAELLSIGSAIPFLTVVTSPENVYNFSFSSKLFSYFGIVEESQIVFFVTSIFVLCVLSAGIIRLILLWVQVKLSNMIGADLSVKIFRNSLYQPYSVHIKVNSSDAISSITKKVDITVYDFIWASMNIVSGFCILASIVTLLIIINPIISLCSLSGFALIYLIVILSTRKRQALNSEIISTKQTEVIKTLQEGYGAIREVLLSRTQEMYCNIFRNADVSMRKSQASMQFISGSPKFIIEALGLVLIALLVCVITITSDGINPYLPIFGALILGAQRMIPILQNVYSNITNMLASAHSIDDTIDLLNLQIPKRNYELTSENNFKNIRFKNVDYIYEGSSDLILKNISLEIKKKDIIGVIGSTGSGKTTFLDVLMGLLIPTKGDILLDEEILNLSNINKWHNIIGHVPQDIYLTDSSILENVAFGMDKKKIDYSSVVEACKKARIHNTILSWDKGYETIVGEKGIKLSGGQKQRIGIARSLYSKPKVLVFDEATSALDDLTEKNVVNEISLISQDLTIIMVAHRLSSLKNCNRIFKIMNKSVIEIKK